MSRFCTNVENYPLALGLVRVKEHFMSIMSTDYAIDYDEAELCSACAVGLKSDVSALITNHLPWYAFMDG